MTGTFDAVTAQAVATFQRARGLLVDGKVGHQTLTASFPERIAEEAHDQLIHLVADLEAIDITTETAAVRFDPTLARRGDASFESSGLRVIRLGRTAFQTSRILRDTIQAQLRPAAPAAAVPGATPAIMTDLEAGVAALINQARLSHPHSVRAVAALVGGAREATWTIDLVQRLADFQQTNGLGGAGVVDLESLEAIVLALRGRGDNNGAIRLIVDFFDFDDASNLISIYFDPTEDANAETLPFEPGNPNQPVSIQIGPAGMAQEFAGIVHTIEHEFEHVRLMRAGEGEPGDAGVPQRGDRDHEPDHAGGEPRRLQVGRAARADELERDAGRPAGPAPRPLHRGPPARARPGRRRARAGRSRAHPARDRLRRGRRPAARAGRPVIELRAAVDDDAEWPHTCPVSVRLRNAGDAPLVVCRRLAPGYRESDGRELFADVHPPGSPEVVSRIKKLYDRDPPTPDEYVALAPGEELAGGFDLMRWYALPGPGRLRARGLLRGRRAGHAGRRRARARRARLAAHAVHAARLISDAELLAQPGELRAQLLDLAAQRAELRLEPLEPAAARLGRDARLRRSGSSTTGGPPSASSESRWTKRSSFWPGRRASRSTSSRSTSESSTSLQRLEAREALHALGALLELAGRLRAAQQQHREHRELLLVEPERLVEQVAELVRAARVAARQPREAALAELVQRLADRRLVVVRRPGRGSSSGCTRAAAR